MELLGLVGEGACGSIFIARDREGTPPTFPHTKWYAVRVYNAIAINRSLIENMVKRLEGGSYPEGVIPIAWIESKQGSRCMIMPMLAEIDEQTATITPRSLQEKMSSDPAADAWPIIEKIAFALAQLHQRRVAHGNLKPGNIFFNENGDIFLTDFATGQMPGVGMLPQTDALLYAPPEQLQDPNGYLAGKGYSWDTFAFAMLAFRLLTGKFPRCEATLGRGIPDQNQAENQADGIEANLHKLSESHDYLELENWCDEAADERERQRRKVIQKCLSVDPQDRYTDMNEVLHAWQLIDTNAEATNEKSGLMKNVRLNKMLMMGSLMIASLAVIGCIALASMLAHQKTGRNSDVKSLNQKISELEKERDGIIAAKSVILKDKNAAEQREKTSRQQSAAREANLRKLLTALGVTTDHLFEWIMRTTSTELPELQKNEHGSDVLARELGNFLKQTEGDNQAKPVRARTLMQLAELAIHRSNPREADRLIDLADTAWKQAGIKEPGFPARLARARLACLLQSLDNSDSVLINSLLPKAHKNIHAISEGDPHENSRNHAIMHIVHGSMVQSTEPAKALENFLLALKHLEGVHNALPDHVALRSQFARYALQSASIADSLNRVDDASKLRHKAANHLRWILGKNPDLKLAKIKLAEIEILSAESEMRAGNDQQGAAKLGTAEKLLSGLAADDTSLSGVAMQIALAKGLRSVLLRDQGKPEDATKTLEEAINVMRTVLAANPGAAEPTYRLAVYHWQRAGLFGDSGNAKGELDQGKQAAALMQGLLKAGAGKRDTELRRSLAYLYGDLGHTAETKGEKTEAASFFKNASNMWQSLIDKNGKLEEYTDGLQWSQSRYREVGGK